MKPIKIKYSNKDSRSNKEKEKMMTIRYIDIKMVQDFLEADEVLNRKVSQMGNSAHISIPVKHLGKNARVIILKDKNK